MLSSTASFVVMSRALVDSSNKITLGFEANAIATITRCASPPDSIDHSCDKQSGVSPHFIISTLIVLTISLSDGAKGSATHDMKDATFLINLYGVPGMSILY
mmetsp:Transcript_28450/g.42202  ORF Transcript_28450/g.42202 Transcript_28450/m.42202 type:complete len:102 (-) Transcript_28450:1338-1643(-)